MENIHDYEQLIAECTEKINQNPDDIKSYTTRGNTYRLKGEYELAIKDFTEAIKYSPEDSYGYSGRVFAYFKFYEKKKAAGEIDKSLKESEYGDLIEADIKLSKREPCDKDALRILLGLSDMSPTEYFEKYPNEKKLIL